MYAIVSAWINGLFNLNTFLASVITELAVSNRLFWIIFELKSDAYSIAVAVGSFCVVVAWEG